MLDGALTCIQKRGYVCVEILVEIQRKFAIKTCNMVETVTLVPDKVFRKKCVIQDAKRHVYWPKKLPRPRSLFVANSLKTIVLVLLIIYLVVVVVFGGFFDFLVTFLVVCLAELVYRSLRLVEEQRHIQSRYKNDWKLLIFGVFPLDNALYVGGLVVGFLAFLMAALSLNNLKLKLELQLPCILINFVYRLSLIAFPTKSPGLGAGMAYSFYFGYLNIILNDEDPPQSKLLTQIEAYEDYNKVKFDLKKLIILIPNSLECPKSLQNAFSPTVIEPGRSLNDYKQTLAGVQNRIYRNSVYKLCICENKKPVYVCAEYASVLDAFNKFLKSDFRRKFHQISESEKQDVVLEFYSTLMAILELTGYKKYCELIYFDDWDNNVQVDVGQVILTRLNDLRKHK